MNTMYTKINFIDVLRDNYLQIHKVYVHTYTQTLLHRGTILPIRYIMHTL